MEKNKRLSLVAVPYGVREGSPSSYPTSPKVPILLVIHACSRKPCESQVELAMGIAWGHHLLSEESPLSVLVPLY